MITAVLVIPFAAYAVVNWCEKKFSRLPVYGEAKEENGKKVPHSIASFSFTNQNATVYSNEAWKDKIVVCDFFFTHCPGICPKLTMSLHKVQEAYKEDKNIIINSFTVDPAGDDAKTLNEYGERFKIDAAKWQLLTGEKKEIYKLARNSFMIVAADGDGGPGDFIHSEKLVLVDTHKRIRGYYNGTDEKEVTQLILDIKKLKHEN